MENSIPTMPNSHKLDWQHWPLWFVVLLSSLGYGLLAIWFPLVPNYSHFPPLDIRSFTPSLLAGLAYGLLLCYLFGLFILAFHRIRTSPRPIGLASILGVSILFSLPLLFVYPINANDIYRYVIRGRITTVYNQNPFTVSPDTYPDDPFLPLAGEWASETSPYGPIWELASSGVTYFSGDNLLLGLLLNKVLVLLAFAGTTIILWLLVRSPGKEMYPAKNGNSTSIAAARTVLWSWNPALLLIFIVDGHNDVVMIFWLLLGLLVIRRGYPVPGFLLMVLGALTKPIGALALPLFFVGVLREKRSFRDRVRFTIAAAAGGLFLGILFFSPFGPPLDLVQRLMREAGTGGAFSPAVLAILLAQKAGMQLTEKTFPQLTVLLLAFFVVLVLWLLWRTWLGRSPIQGTADIFFGYIIQAFNFRIWYAAWPYPWLLLGMGSEGRNKKTAFRFHYGFWFLFTSQLSVLIYGHTRVYALDGSQIAAHILGVMFTFGVPFLLAWISRQSILLNLSGMGN